MGNELSIRELRDETRQFEHARDLIADAEHGEWPEVEDPGQCYNCGAFAKTYDGHTYVAPCAATSGIPGLTHLRTSETDHA